MTNLQATLGTSGGLLFVALANVKVMSVSSSKGVFFPGILGTTSEGKAIREMRVELSKIRKFPRVPPSPM
jgi:hypothetical protein